MAGVLLCIVCNRTIGKSGYKIQCQGKCDGWAHLGCTDVSKDDIIKKKRFEWSCLTCKNSIKNLTADDGILEELAEKLMKRRSIGKSTNVDEDCNVEAMFKKLIKKMDELEEAVSFNSEVVDDLRKAMEEIKKENKNMKREHNNMKEEISKLRGEVNELKEQASLNATMAEAQNRRKNIILIGLSNKDEVVKVFSKLEIQVPENEIKVRQLPSRKQSKPILVEFEDEKMKNLVLQRRKLMGPLNSENMKLDGEQRKIFINEDLPKEVQALLRKARELKMVGFRVPGALPEIRHKTAVSTIRSTAERAARDKNKYRSDDTKKKVSQQKEITKASLSPTSPAKSKRDTVTHRLATAYVPACRASHRNTYIYDYHQNQDQCPCLCS